MIKMDIKLILNRDQESLLLDVLEIQNAIGLIQKNETGLFCKSSDQEKIRQAVLDEFCSSGLRDDDEPNQRGLELEDLIDAIGSGV